MNTKDRFLKVKAVFHEAMELPASDRKLYVMHACGSDLELRREVELLLNDDQAEALSQAIRNQVSPSLVGKTLDGRYRLEALIGEGGMGSVFRGTDTRLRATVAVKVLPPHLSSSADYVDRFQREAQAARMIQHPNVVTVHDVGTTADNISYLVMEHIEGQSLAALLKHGRRFPIPETLGLLEPIANALNVAHARGIVHRDVKPANIMVTDVSGGTKLVKLLDLGIAKVQESTTLTVGGLSMGTPQYMAPEQWGVVPADGNPQIDGRADIYSLGIVFFEMALGKRPFEGDTHQVLFNQHAHIAPPRLHDLDATISPEVSQVIERTLAKDRKDRPATCEILVRELTQAANAKPPAQAVPAKPAPVPLAATQAAPTPPVSLKETVPAMQVDTNPPSLPIPIPTRRKTESDGSQMMKRGLVVLAILLIVGFGFWGIQSSKVSIPEMEFVKIPAGSFQMGSNNGDNEKPVHQVTIKQPFYLGKYEVTQTQWRAVMGNNPSIFKGDNLPVENVSWGEVQEFIKRLNANGNETYRLPTEAEWEYACRAGTTGDFAGDLDSMGWYDSNSDSKTHPVGQKKPNEWGLYDMHGNVWEWCQDWYGPYPSGPVTDPRGPESGSYRVNRGGGWNYTAPDCRSAFRDHFSPGIRVGFLGFRLLRTAR